MIQALQSELTAAHAATETATADATNARQDAGNTKLEFAAWADAANVRIEAAESQMIADRARADAADLRASHADAYAASERARAHDANLRASAAHTEAAKERTMARRAKASKYRWIAAGQATERARADAQVAVANARATAERAAADAANVKASLAEYALISASATANSSKGNREMQRVGLQLHAGWPLLALLYSLMCHYR